MATPRLAELPPSQSGWVEIDTQRQRLRWWQGKEVNYECAISTGVAMFSRYLDPFSERFHTALDELEAHYQGQPIPLEVLLETMATTVLAVPAERNSLKVFMRLLGLAYSQAQGHLRRYIQQQYGDVFTRFTELVRKATPELPDAERFWRLHFMLGTVIFTLSGLDALRDIAAKVYQEQVTVRDLVRRLRPVVVAAMNAPLPAAVEEGNHGNAQAS